MLTTRRDAEGAPHARLIRWLCLLVLLVLLSGCGKKTLVENTTQKRAMQIVVALYRQGVAANAIRESGGQGKYRVEVEDHDYARALATIDRGGLLDEPAPTFEELTASSSFFPPSREVEALRLDHALALEVKGLLEQLGGVEHAEVVVRKRFGSRNETPPSVSVVLRVQQGAAMSEQAIIDVVLRSVPGLEPERIFITTEQAPDVQSGSSVHGATHTDGSLSYVPLVPFVFKWRVPKDDYASFAGMFLVSMFLAGSLCLFLGYVLGQVRGRKAAESGDVDGPARLERPKRDLLEG